MVNKDLVQKLHDKGIIDKRNVYWWQIGFEGRRIFTDEEFQNGLVNISWMPELIRNHRDDNLDFSREDYEKAPKSVSVWVKHDVPILLKDVSIDDHVVPCFVTVKPLSHDRREGWRDLTWDMENKYPMNWVSKFHQPHIRGMVLEQTDRILFWSPLLMGTIPMSYHTRGMQLGNYFAIIDPVYPSDFYKNLIKGQWSFGRRAQKSAATFNCLENGYHIVPYFEFDKGEKHVTVYPAPILASTISRREPWRLMRYVSLPQFEAIMSGDLSGIPNLLHGPLSQFVRWKKDFPIVVKSNPGSDPEILGMGYTSINYYKTQPLEDARFWQIPDKFKGQVKDYLGSKGML
jgi:hypothetical protein